MSSKKTKLELTWIGKEHRPKLEPRILLEEADNPLFPFSDRLPSVFSALGEKAIS